MGRLLSDCTGRSCSLTMGFCYGVWGEIQWLYRDSSWQGSFCAWVGGDWVQYPQPLLFSHFNQCSQCIAAFLNGKVCYGLFFLWWALFFVRYFEASLIPQRVVSDQEDTYQKAWKMVKTLWPKPKHGFDLGTGNTPCLRTCYVYAELSWCRANTSVKLAFPTSLTSCALKQITSLVYPLPRSSPTDGVLLLYMHWLFLLT